MAKITSVDKFFGLDPTSWVERRYGDVLSIPIRAQVRDNETQLSSPVKLFADPSDGLNLVVRYQEIVATVTTTVGARNPRTGQRDPGNINIQQARAAIASDMLEDPATSTNYPVSGTIPIILEDQDTHAGEGTFISQRCRQNSPALTSDILPGMIFWMTTKEAVNEIGNPIMGWIFRIGPPEV